MPYREIRLVVLLKDSPCTIVQGTFMLARHRRVWMPQTTILAFYCSVASASS